MFVQQFLDLLESIGEFQTEKLKIYLENICLPQFPLFFTTDSRKIKENSVFIPIKGKNVNGHDHVNESFKKGAILSIVEDTGDYNGLCIKVDNCINFINQMASFLFSKYSGYTIAITGSNGKTSTKEWIKNLLSNFNKKSSIFANKGNMNTEIGLPLCILNELSDHRKMSVVEMGMSKMGDIKFLVDSYPPDFPVLLNIGTAHIGNTGSLDQTFLEKLNILNNLKHRDQLCLNCSDPFLKSFIINNQRLKPVLFGEEEDKIKGYNGVYLNKYCYIIQNMTTYTEVKLTIVNKQKETQIKQRFFGIFHKGQLLNLCASLSVVSSLGYDIDSLDKLSDSIGIVKDRFEPIFKGDHLLIKDCYNSSFESLGYALDILKDIKDNQHFQKTYCVLGSIAEIGPYGSEFYEKIGEKLKDSQVDTVFLFTKDPAIKQIQKSYKGEVLCFDCISTISREIIRYLKAEDRAIFLFKASRSIKLEEVYDHVMDAVD